MSEILTTIANLAIVTFVLSSMVALGLSLTMKQIVDPLANLRLVATALAANFIVAPAAAWAVASLLDLDDSLTLGLLLLGTAAGAPFLPKLAQMAKGDVAYSGGLMVLLMVITVAYIPLVLVPLVEGVEVSAWDIARPLLLAMLLPLAIALLVRSRYPDSAKLAPPLNQISTISLALTLVLALVLGLPQLIDAFGTGAFLAAILFAVICIAAGYLLGGRDRSQRWVTSLGTAQRNISAALLIATTSFRDQPEVLIMVMVAAVIALAILLPLAAELGKRTPDVANATR
jgi:BASS family bile acid:Na+ symporter